MPEMAPFTLRKAVHRARGEGFSLRKATQKPGGGGYAPVEKDKGGGMKAATKKARRR